VLDYARVREVKGLFKNDAERRSSNVVQIESDNFSLPLFVIELLDKDDGAAIFFYYKGIREEAATLLW
jgi:hypothetical protein